MDIQNNALQQDKVSQEASFTDLDLKKQVAKDLLERLDSYTDSKKGLKALSRTMGIHEKTLKRLIDRENKPGYQTLLKIYRALLSTENDTELLKNVTPVVQYFLMKGSPRLLDESINYHLNVDQELIKNPVFCELYFLAAAGGITKEWVGYQYGKYGETIFSQMVSQNVLAQADHHKYILGPNQAALKPQTLKHVGLHLSERFTKPEMSDQEKTNFTSFYTAQLDKETYEKWLEIDEQAFKEKVELIKKSKSGGIKAFHFSTTDTLTESVHWSELH